MANIKNELNNIKSAVFGKDVRNSIHDAIEQCYTDASINGNANMEVKLARGTHNTLKTDVSKIKEDIASINKNIEAILELLQPEEEPKE